jgi:septum formation protein
VSGARVVLASASPRRRELLNLIGIAHEVRPANIDETMRPREAPRRYAERLAREKASAIATRDPDLITIGADTVVVISRKVLGKPADADDAARMLRMLSGREHTVITAVAVSRGRKLRSAIEEVRVKFRRLRDDEIDAYIAMGEPMDKAGAYGIQGLASRYIDRVEGGYFNVVGLPMSLVYRHLKTLGYFQ